MTPTEIFSRAWDILVEHAETIDDEHTKKSFAEAYAKDRPLATEWRFGGTLGFGGKFWRNDCRYYISCYPEDETPKRLKVIEKVNKLLAELPYFEPPVI